MKSLHLLYSICLVSVALVACEPKPNGESVPGTPPTTATPYKKDTTPKKTPVSSLPSTVNLPTNQAKDVPSTVPPSVTKPIVSSELPESPSENEVPKDIPTEPTLADRLQVEPFTDDNFKEFVKTGKAVETMQIKENFASAIVTQVNSTRDWMTYFATSTDGAKTWVLNDKIRSKSVFDMKYFMRVDGQDIDLFFDDYGIDVSHDFGATWQTRSISELRLSGKNKITAFARDGERLAFAIFEFSEAPRWGYHLWIFNAGTWKKIDLPQSLRDIIAEVRIYGDEIDLRAREYIYRSLDLGKTWTRQELDDNSYKIFSYGPEWFVGKFGGRAYIADPGQTMLREINLGLTSSMYITSKYIVRSNFDGEAEFSFDRGLSWTVVPTKKVPGMGCVLLEVMGYDDNVFLRCPAAVFKIMDL